MKIDQYSLIEQSAVTANYNRAYRICLHYSQAQINIGYFILNHRIHVWVLLDAGVPKTRL